MSKPPALCGEDDPSLTEVCLIKECFMKFQYLAKQGPDRYQSGIVEAGVYREAVQDLLRQGMVPVDVHEKKDSLSDRVIGASGWRFRIIQDDICSFVRFVSDFLNAGIPLLKSLELARRHCSSGRMACALDLIQERVADGTPLSSALEEFPGLFSGMLVNMIRAGETSGTLGETFCGLADFLEQDRDIRLKIVSSLLYPLVIVVFAGVTVFILLIWVIPGVTAVFEEMNQPLPWATRVLTGISRIFVRWWRLFVAGTAAGIFFAARWSATARGRAFIHQKILKIPVIGTLIRECSLSRFSRTFGTLLNGGIEIVPALTLSAGVVENRHIRDYLLGSAEAVSAGMPFSAAARSAGIFSEADISVLSAGEETGILSRGLFRLAEFYEKSSRRRLNIIMSLLEPGLILGLGLVIGCLVLAMLMPVFQMNIMAP